MPTASESLFKALADPTRRGIFERLARDGELTVHALTDHSGVSQPMVSKHLAALKAAGLVRDRREGRETHYSARPQSLAPMVDWLGQYAAFWRERFDRLEDLLKRMDQ
ncbi:MAG TPA: metalloregulator ArsR/SmtB family transcription factor [Steroidobacteraceae bacterium]|jgi:DNA-binding transcriptional ArsR family regulator|nr:metalloregulator ArsR/SmtB family transcription factor [Steroidobacteraceae bacterium]